MADRTMSPDEARRALASANNLIATAAQLLACAAPILERFLEEDRSADSVLPILDPTLWMSRERRETADLLRPVYQAALDLLRPVYQAALDLLRAHRAAAETLAARTGDADHG